MAPEPSKPPKSSESAELSVFDPPLKVDELPVGEMENPPLNS